MPPYRYVIHERVKLQINYSSYCGVRASGFYRTWDRWLAIKPASFWGPLVLSSKILSLLASGRISLRILLITRESMRLWALCPIIQTYVSPRSFQRPLKSEYGQGCVHPIDNARFLKRCENLIRTITSTRKDTSYLRYCSIYVFIFSYFNP